MCTYIYNFQVVETAMMNTGVTYRIPNVHIKGHACKTNLPSNTAFRGFGIPEAYLIVESCITEVAEEIGIKQVEVSLNALTNYMLCTSIIDTNSTNLTNFRGITISLSLGWKIGRCFLLCTALLAVLLLYAG